MTDRDLTTGALLMYVRKRGIRQLDWFSNSARRLEQGAKSRARFLLVLYIAVVGSALLKWGLLMFAGDKGEQWGVEPWINSVLLLLTGLSAVLAAYYLNQNSRSLIHRYLAQLRKIKEWLAALEATIDISEAGNERLMDQRRERALELVVGCESIMVDELLDWIHITRKDSIELSP